MANEEHVAILEQGVEVWNDWRKNNPDIKPDLSSLNLDGKNLERIDFWETNLYQVSLIRTNLTGAKLRRSNLYEVDFSAANLSKVNFYKYAFAYEYFRDTKFRKTKFRDARFKGPFFLHADLTNADFRGADLGLATFVRSTLDGANFAGANIHGASFNDVDLSNVIGLDRLKHGGPSSISIDTIYRSKDNLPESFLRGVGVPDNFIEYMYSLTNDAFDFYSCFISHSSKDQEFVARLYADLQSNGVRCWYAPEDLKIGEPFLLGIDQGIRLHDKLLLVLSEQSVNSGWVQQEVLSALAKEQGKEPWVLFPIRLDDAVMDTTVPWANMIRQSRHIGDFTRWKDHGSYKKAFDRLLRDLKGKSSA